MNNIVLFQPEIPANTGNIARTCVGTNTRLHLIRPLGFSIDDKHVKRAGLDYWEHLDLVVWDSFDEFLEATNDKHYYLITKFGSKNYCDFDFSNEENEDIYFIFGRETNVRSLNLSNTAALIIYEALRQQNFNKLQ